MSRRLAAIMFTDLEGYTSLAHADEAGSLRVLAAQEKLVHPLLVAHRGKAIKSMGDGMLLEFPNARDAVECAVAIQRAAHDLNARDVGPKVRMRIGIHLGDVEDAEGDVLGDTVNIASRIEPLAEVGGVTFSSQVFEQVRNKVPYQLERLGAKIVKGIPEPIDTYRVVLPWMADRSTAAGGLTARLAVLPLKNISPDPADEYIADGLHEELITALSRNPRLRVISRTSTSQFKGKSETVGKIGAELDVSTILEGSVRRAGDQLRITLQLIDVKTDEHRWAETYNRKLDDVFAVQADIARQVAEQLQLATDPAGVSGLAHRPAVRPESYLAYLKGQSQLHGVSDIALAATEDALESARQQFELAISLDASNAAAHAALSYVVQKRGWFHAGHPWSAHEEIARRSALKAIELDPTLAAGHAALALILRGDLDWAAAEREFRQALTLDPSDSGSHAKFAIFLQDLGRGEEAVREFEQAVESDPLEVDSLGRLANLLLELGRSEEAYPRIDRVRQLDSGGHMYHGLLSEYYWSRSDGPAALREHQEFSKAFTGEPWEALNRALGCVLAGDPVSARSLLRQLDDMPLFPAAVGSIIDVYGRLGDVDDCFRWIERGLHAQALPLQNLRMNPDLESVRRDPRFQDLLKRLKLA